MKIKLLLPLLGALSYFSAPALAQNDDAPTSKPGAVAPYRTSVGLRFSPSGKYGTDLTITARHFIRPESAIEAQVGLFNFNRGYQASLQYVWQPQLLSSQRLRPYAGIGIGITGTEFNRYGEQQSMATNLTGIASVGIEYTFSKIPLALSLDYRFAFVGDTTDPVKDVPLNRFNNVGVTVKYTFGR